MKDLLEQFCQKKVLQLALSREKVVFFTGKRPFLGMYVLEAAKSLLLLMIFWFYFIFIVHDYRFQYVKI